MTPEEFEQESRKRTTISEGRKNIMYYDENNIATIGIGCNLERGDGPQVMQRIGANYNLIMQRKETLTDAQINELFEICWGPIISDARGSLAPGVFDSLSDARRYVVCDLRFQLGESEWMKFAPTRHLINQAMQTHDMQERHAYFGEVCNHLLSSAWYVQSGNRSRRNVAMMKTSVWCKPTGDGSDIL